MSDFCLIISNDFGIEKSNNYKNCSQTNTPSRITCQQLSTCYNICTNTFQFLTSTPMSDIRWRLQPTNACLVFFFESLECSVHSSPIQLTAASFGTDSAFYLGFRGPDAFPEKICGLELRRICLFSSAGLLFSFLFSQSHSFLIIWTSCLSAIAAVTIALLRTN